MSLYISPFYIMRLGVNLPVYMSMRRESANPKFNGMILGGFWYYHNV